MSSDERTLRQLTILQRINEYVQVTQDPEKVLDAFLTGVTGGYGLGFNRGAALLLDEREPVLSGRRGIGYLELKEAQESWRLAHGDRLSDFEAYLERLDKDGLPATPIGQRVKEVHVAVSQDGKDPLSRSVLERLTILVEASNLHELPPAVYDLFKPTSEMIVVPMIARDRVIGVFLADNKFTRASITHADIELLLTFTTTAALAIDNIELFHRVQTAREGMRRFFKASSAVSTSKDPQEVLEDIVAQTRVAANATWVRLILSDELGRARTVITKGTDREVEPAEAMRPDGIGAQVLRSEEPEVIENTDRERHRINPKLLEERPQSFICLPLALHGKKFGVMWINYSEPRTFTEFDIDTLQLYVHQAAIAYDGARRMNELSHMRRAAEAQSEASDSQELLRQIVESAHSALQADSAAIWPFDNVRNSFVPENFVASNIPSEFLREFGKARPRPGGTAHSVMERRWVIVEDIALATSDFLGDSTRNLLASIGVRSFIGVALTVGEENLGVLYLNYNRTRSFNEEEQQLARTFANHAALALKKAKLLEQVTKAKKAAEAVARVTVLGNRPSTLQSIATEMQRALDCSCVIVFEYDKETRKLYPPTMIGVTKPDRVASLREVDPNSIVYLMLNRDTPYIAENVTEDPLFHDRRFTIEEHIKSCVAVPLKVMEQRVGVIFVNYRHHHTFTRDEIDNINLFADQAAVAIRNAQMFEERNSQLRRQGALVELSEELLSIPTLQETLDRAVQFAAEMLNTDFASIVLPNRSGELTFSATHGWDQKIAATFKVPSGRDSQTGYTIETGNPVMVYDYQAESRFRVTDIVFAQSIRSGVSVPMVRDGKIIGAMLVHSKEERHFTTEDVALLSLVANETAIALKSAEQYEQTLRNTSYLGALHEASKAINSSFGEAGSTVLDAIVKQAVEGISGIGGPKAILGNIMFLDAEQDTLLLESVYVKKPDGIISHREDAMRDIAVSIDRLREGWPLKKELCPNGRIGITGRAAIQRVPQLVRNVDDHPDFIRIHSSTKSELAVPLIDGDRVLGVLNVESDQIGGFDINDQTHLQALGDLAVIAIRNTERFRELAETKGLVGARTALAWMGMATTSWRHAIEEDAVNIRNVLTLIRDLDLKSERIVDQDRLKLNKRMDNIDLFASRILERKITPPLSSEEGVEKVLINDFLSERILQLWDHEPYSQYEFEFEFAEKNASVTLSPEWFRRALDILVNNAIEAMANSPIRKLTIRTILTVPREVQIEIRDTGKGMNPEIANKIFKEGIRLSDRAKGFGVGLLMVQAIVHTYNGQIHLKETGPNGTSMLIRFPLSVSQPVSLQPPPSFEVSNTITRTYGELERAYEELLVLDRRKMELLSTVSHELRNPLASIKAGIQMLLKEVYGPLQTNQRTRLELVQSSVHEEIELIEDLLDLSRIQEGKESLDLKIENLSLLVSDIVNAYTQDAGDKQLSLLIEPIIENIEVSIDAKKIKRVLKNLVKNAINFTDSGYIKISAITQPDVVEIRVEDTGIGIPEQEHEKIFDWFYQVDSSLTREYKGIGVGLYLARKYVEMHGGEIRVEKSQPKVGSTFFVSLPRLT